MSSKGSLIFALLVLVGVGSGMVLGQPPRRTTTTTMPPEQAEVLSGSDDPMQAFGEKGLPEPMVLGASPSAALAASLASKILKYDEESLAVLIAAIQKAGFSIIDSNQKLLYRSVSGSNGMSFYDFEVAGMLRSSGMGAVTTVEKFAKSLANNEPALESLDLGNSLLSDLRQSRSAKDPQAQFLASLIFELGKKTADLSTATPGRARLNIIQASLIERALLGEFLAAYEEYESQNASSRSTKHLFGRRDAVMFVSAAWNPAVEDCGAISDITKLQGAESKIKKVGNLIFGEKTMPSIFTQPKEFIKKKFENFAKGIEKANLIMSWAKLVIAYLNLEAKITVEDPMPLIRTKHDRNYGEQRIVKAVFTMNFKHSARINCAGKAIKGVTGIDLSVPENGPLKNVPVTWLPVLEGRGYERFTDFPVWLDSTDGSRGDISKQVTDGTGASQIKMTGKPQAKNLEQAAVVPLGKKAELKVSVAKEDMDASEDIPKIFWFGVGNDFGISALLELAPDVLSKMKLKDFRVVVPVRDWQPCSADWGGTLRAVLEKSETIVIKANRMSNGNSTGDGTKRMVHIDEVNVTLNPRTDEEMKTMNFSKPAYLDLRGYHYEIDERLADGNPCCGKQEGNFKTKVREGKEMKYFQTQRKLVTVVVRSSDRDYELIFSVEPDHFPVKWRNFKETETNCPIEDESFENILDSTYGVGFHLFPGRYGQRFVNSAGELYSGTKSLDLPNNFKITWTWNLARCKN